MTSQPLYMKPHPVWGQHIHLTCHITATICVITPTVSTRSHPLFLWHHTLHMCGIICIIQHITASISDLKPPFWGHHTHDIRHRVHCICVITPPLSMNHSHYVYDITSSICDTFCPLYLWHRTNCVWHHNALCWLHHTWHMYDIIWTTEHVPTTLPIQATIVRTSHPLQAWHHPHFIRHRTNGIFVITTSPLISHPLLYGIISTICVTSCVLYITSHPIPMSSHYSSYDSTILTYETTYSMQFQL